MKCGITGWGMYVPQVGLMNNAELIERYKIGTTPEWIQTRTGVFQRYIAPDGVTVIDLAVKAGQLALNRAGVAPEEVDLIILATSTPRFLIPASAYIVADSLGASRAGAFDANASCSGFVYALATAAGMICSKMVKTALVIGADTISKIVDWGNRSTCILFGDGAGAFVLQFGKAGFLAFDIGGQSCGWEKVYAAPGGVMHMDNRAVFESAVKIFGATAADVVKKARRRMDSVKLIIPHQANSRILLSRYTALPVELIFSNIHKYGNTSAASIPIAWCDAMEQQLIRPGDLVLLAGFGGGFSWASSLLKI